MNKNIFRTAMLAATACVMASCTETANDRLADSGSRTVRLAAYSSSNEMAIGPATRAADGLYTATEGFAGEEEMEVYVLENTRSTTTNATYKAATADESTKRSPLTAKSGDPLEYPTTGTANVYAVYPAASAAAMAHVVRRDQSADAAYQASDLMYAHTAQLSQGDMASIQTLNFEHRLVKVVFNITKDASVNQLTGVTLLNAKRRVLITSVDQDGMTLGDVQAAQSGDQGYAADEATNNSITVSATEAASGDTETYTYACVLPAQSWSDAPFLKVSTTQGDVTYKLTKSFVAGKGYTVSLTVTDGLLHSTVQLSAWGTVSDVVINALTPSTLDVADISQTLVYNGSARTPSTAPAVKSGATTLTSGTHYTLKYYNNVNAGENTAMVVAVGQGAYAGQMGYKWFSIQKAEGVVKFSPESPVIITAGEGSGTFTVMNATETPATATVGNITYGGKGNTLEGSDVIADNAGNTVTYKYETRSRVGVVTIPVTVAATDNYKEATANFTLYIKKDKAAVSVAPTTTDPTYNNSNQALVKAGSTDEGTLLYALGDDDTTAPDASKYAATIPTGKDAGDYYVWYYIKGDDVHFDSDPTPVKVTMKKAAQTVTLSLTSIPNCRTLYGQTFKVTRSGNGEITAVSSDTTAIKVAEVNQSTGVVTLTGVGIVTSADIISTITVTVAEGDNYLAYTATDKQVSVTNPKYPVDLSIALVGDIVASDGKAYLTVADATAAGQTAVGVVAKLLTTKLNTESNSKSTYKNITPSRGVAIALCNAKSQWTTSCGTIAANGNFTTAVIDAVTTLYENGTIKSGWTNLDKTSWPKLLSSVTGLNTPITSKMVNASDYTNMSGNLWSTSPYGSSYSYLSGSSWYHGNMTCNIRPVFAF